MSSYVIDASVGIKLFLDEEFSTEVRAWFRRVITQIARGSDPVIQLLVPDSFYIECANVLWKRAYIHGDYPVSAAMESLADLKRMAFTSIPTSELAEGSLDIAVSHGISAYDACYVELSHRYQATMLTADERLIAKLAGSPFDVQSIVAPIAPTG